jgi:hypothetical protein
MVDYVISYRVGVTSTHQTSPLRLHGSLPVQVDSCEAILIHELGRQLDEGSPVFMGGIQVTLSRERAACVTKQVAANSDLGICVKGCRIIHERNVSVILGPNPKGLRVDGRKGEEGMDVALSLDISGYDAVAQTVFVEGQVITNGPALCGSRALAARSENLARAEVFLASCELVWPDAVNLGCPTPLT